MKKIKLIKSVIISILVISILAGCTGFKSQQNVYRKLENLFVSTDYETVYSEYGDFFNDQNKIADLQKERPNDYEDIISSYQSKYLVSILGSHKDEYLDQFEKIRKDMNEFNFRKLILNIYQTLMRDTKENDELYYQLVKAINEIDIDFENSDYDSLYFAFECFCNMIISDKQENCDMVDEIIICQKEKYGENFQDFWYNVSTQYIGVLLHNEWYNRFRTVFISSCSIEGYSPITSISYLINMEELDKEQLNVLADAVYELSNKTEDYNRKEALKKLSELARTQKPKTTQGT